MPRLSRIILRSVLIRLNERYLKDANLDMESEMSEEKSRRFDVFIAYYSGTGLDFARFLNKKLKDFDTDAFLDEEDIPKSIKSGTEEWRAWIDKAIINSDRFVLIMTIGFNTRREVLRELELAMDNNIERIHCRHKDLGGKDLLVEIEGKQIDLSRYEYVTFDSEADLVRKVVMILKKKAEIEKYNIPPIFFEITQLIGRGATKRTPLPEVGFNIMNLGDLPVRFRVKTRVLLGNSDLGLIRNPKKPYYSGGILWSLNPHITFFGVFSVPRKCLDSVEDLRIEVQVTVIDNYERLHELNPACYTYVGNENRWISEPTSFSELKRFKEKPMKYN